MDAYMCPDGVPRPAVVRPIAPEVVEEKIMVTRDHALTASSPVLAVVVGELLLSGVLLPGARALRPGETVRRLLGLSRG